jgi:hypothetical protein
MTILSFRTKPFEKIFLLDLLLVFFMQRRANYGTRIIHIPRALERCNPSEIQQTGPHDWRCCLFCAMRMLHIQRLSGMGNELVTLEIFLFAILLCTALLSGPRALVIKASTSPTRRSVLFRWYVYRFG